MKVKVINGLISLVLVLTILCMTILPATADDLKVTDYNLNCLQNRGSWTQYSNGDTGDLLNYPSTGTPFDAIYSKPLMFHSINAVTMADYQGYYWGECVSFAKFLSKSTVETKYWKTGRNVISSGDVLPGTVIATFDGKDNYDKNDPIGNEHTAIFRDYIRSNGKITGIKVWDQNYIGTSTVKKIHSHVVGRHNLMTSGSGLADADRYFVVVIGQANPSNPASPTSLTQYKSDGKTGIAVGGTTTESSVVLKGIVSDPKGSKVQLEVEVEPINKDFSNTPTFPSSSSVDSGSTASVLCTGLPNGKYQWQARARNSQGITGPWQFAGGNAKYQSDFVVNAPSAKPVITLTCFCIGQQGTIFSFSGYGFTPNKKIDFYLRKPYNNGTKKSTLTTSSFGTTNYNYSIINASDDSGTVIKTLDASNSGAISYNYSSSDTNLVGTDYFWAVDKFNGTKSNEVSVDLPTALTQFKSDGVSGLALGGTTTENTVVMKGGVSDPGGRNVMLEVEVKPLGTAFTGTSTYFSSSVASGSKASTTCTGLSNGQYHWRARAKNSNDAAGPWLSAGGNPENQPDFVVSVTTSPSQPTSLTQYKSDGITVLALGGTTTESTVVVKGGVSDPSGNSLRLEIEIEPIGTDFTGTPTYYSSYVTSGSTASATCAGLSNGQYHWQARAKNSNGVTGQWLSAGGNAESQPDFVVSVVTYPGQPISLTQYKSDGFTGLALGGTTTESTVVVKGGVTDPSGNSLRLEIEIEPIGTDFTGTPTYYSSYVASGSTASATCAGLSNGQYHWQARAKNSNGVTGQWLSAGGNAESQPDFKVETVVKPSINYINPTQVTAGDFDLTIYGNNFDSGVVDQIYRSDGVTPVGQGTNVRRYGTQFVVTEHMAGAPAGVYVVKVKNSNGQESTTGVNLQVNAPTSIQYQGQFANTGWGNWAQDGNTIGTPSSSANQMEAIRIQISNYGVTYRAHVAIDGWQNWFSNGQAAGTVGQGKSLQAIRIQLQNAPYNMHVKYRVYVNGAWQSWFSDGEMAGTTGNGWDVKAIQIQVYTN